MLLMLALLATASPPDCQRPDGPGLCLGLEDLRERATVRADRDRCLAQRIEDTEAAVRLAQALQDATEAREDAEARLTVAKRRRWRWVAVGAASGVAVSAGVVWAGVQVVGAR